LKLAGPCGEDESLAENIFSGVSIQRSWGRRNVEGLVRLAGFGLPGSHSRPFNLRICYQGVAVMTSPAVKPIPDGMHSLTPYLICANAAEAIAFYTKAFNAVEQFRLPGPDGKVMHACLKIGDSMLMLTDEWPEHQMAGPNTLNGTPVTIHHYVQDVDASFKQAVEAGATVTLPVTDMFWGDRYGQLKDPFGHRWSLATHTRDMSADDIQQAMASAMK
jgi:PhnB protein